MVGDFSIHVEWLDDVYAISLLNIFELFQLHNSINQPTRSMGGTLDLIVSSVEIPPPKCIVFPSGVLSDHSYIKAVSPYIGGKCKKTKTYSVKKKSAVTTTEPTARNGKTRETIL